MQISLRFTRNLSLLVPTQAITQFLFNFTLRVPIAHWEIHPLDHSPKFNPLLLLKDLTFWLNLTKASVKLSIWSMDKIVSWSPGFICHKTQYLMEPFPKSYRNPLTSTIAPFYSMPELREEEWDLSPKLLTSTSQPMAILPFSKGSAKILN